MPIKVSIRKADIYARRGNFKQQGISPMEEANQIFRRADEDVYDALIKRQEKRFYKEFSRNSFH